MQKIKPYRNKKYKAWVKEQPCSNCRDPFGIDPHHLTGVGGMSGMGMTAPDSMLMPLCRKCHTKLHATPEMWDQQWEWVCRCLNSALAEGILK